MKKTFLKFIVTGGAFLLLALASCKKDAPSGDSGSVTDCQGNVYRTVRIDDKIWMAENLKCLKYDTESELQGKTLSFSTPDKAISYTPYCIDATKKENWKTDEFAGKLSESQLLLLGTLYNWAAAVGLEDEEDIVKVFDFPVFRQGICPNGWHLPDNEEWIELMDYLGGQSVAGQKLKAGSGWYDGGQGTDNYDFNALPAGEVLGPDLKIWDTGKCTFIWAAAPSPGTQPDYITKNYSVEMTYGNSSLVALNSIKSQAGSVRCVKDY